MSTSTIGGLCSECAKIPFDISVLNAQSKPQSGYHSWSMMMSRRRIADTPSCPFCRLVSLALYEWQRTRDAKNDWSRWHDAVTLMWAPPEELESSRPWSRGRFYLTLALDAKICFADTTGPEEQSGHTTSAAKYLLPFIPAELDMKRVTGWIEKCESSHSGACQLGDRYASKSFDEIFPGLQLMRLVDVKTYRLVETSTMQRYVALSYVWGSTIKFRLTKANKAPLMELDGLRQAIRLLPTTIHDAIILCIKLKVCYLWVDALCLLQDDEEDVARGVDVMDQIYEQSWLTVVAACGHDANAGLPGVRPGTRPRVEIAVEVKPGISLGVVMPLYTLMDQSLYSSRAWTGRALTNEGDAQRAMAGIMRRFSENLGYPFHEGLPSAALDAFILFYRMDAALRRRRGFPSYSWTGWRGTVGLSHVEQWDSERTRRYIKWLTQQTWIIWYKREVSSGKTSLVWDPSRHPELLRTTTWDTPGWGLPKAQSEKEERGKVYDGYLERRPFKAMKSPGAQGLPAHPTSDEKFKVQPDGITYHLLQFWTLSLTFRLGHINVFDAKSSLVGTDSGLRGRYEDICGSIYLDGFEDSSEFFASTDPVEVILLSESRQPFFDIKFMLNEEERAYGHNGSAFYNVMVLEWSGGFAERRGIGSIRQSAVSQSFSSPVWKEILLG